MATELFSLVGFYTGWLSDSGAHCSVSAEFNGHSWYHISESRATAERAFYKAAHRALLRKWLKKFGISLPLEKGYQQ